MLLPLTVPVAVFNLDTFFSEFDYWAGTFMLVVFAFFETILFGWVFGMDKGWAELNKLEHFGQSRLGDEGVLTMMTVFRDVFGGVFQGARESGAPTPAPSGYASDPPPGSAQLPVAGGPRPPGSRGR